MRLEGVEVADRRGDGDRREQVGVGLGDDVEGIGQRLLPRSRELLAVVTQEVDQPVGGAQTVQRPVGEQGRMVLTVGG